MNQYDERPNRTPGHSWVCDCGTCMGDGNESQWHRLREPHPCSELDGAWWWPAFGAMASWQQEAYRHLHGSQVPSEGS